MFNRRGIILLIMALMTPVLWGQESILGPLWKDISSWAEGFIQGGFSNFSLLFFSLFLLLLLPKISTKRPYSLLYWFSLLVYTLWMLIPIVRESLNFGSQGILIANLASGFLSWAFLIFFYRTFSRNFTGKWKSGVAIPLMIFSFFLIALDHLDYIYQVLPFTLLREIRDFLSLPYGNLAVGLFLFCLSLRLIIGLVQEEGFRLSALVSFLGGVGISSIPFLQGQGIHHPIFHFFMTYTMAGMLILGLPRLLGAKPGSSKETTEPQEERLYRELSQSKETLAKLQRDLADEDSTMGRVIQKSQKLRESLLPTMIYPDDLWEAAVYYQAADSKQPDYYDFMYSYGRRLKGALFFDIQNGMNGSFTGSWLKGILPAQFSEASSLSSLYRQLHNGTEQFREGRDLIGQMVRFHSDELEYCGWKNAPMLFRKASMNKAAPLIQDKVKQWQNLKSYRIQVEKGDALLMANNPFYLVSHPITEEAYGIQRASEAFSESKGKAADMLKEVISNRLNYYGDKRFNRGVFIICLRRKDS